MCNISGIIFGATNLRREEIEGKSVIEVGSKDVNGSLRSYIESRYPSKYVGIDIEMGPGVDIICNAENMIDKFGKEAFDIVISTELIEHVKDWRKVISNFKNICKKGGIILVTTRSHGFKYHGYPNDFWRYESNDMKTIFSDFLIEKIEKDELSTGVFIKAKKPEVFLEKSLSYYDLYSIIVDKRIKTIDKKTLADFKKSYRWKTRKKKAGNYINKIISKIF